MHRDGYLEAEGVVVRTQYHNRTFVLVRGPRHEAAALLVSDKSTTSHK